MNSKEKVIRLVTFSGGSKGWTVGEQEAGYGGRRRRWIVDQNIRRKITEVSVWVRRQGRDLQPPKTIHFDEWKLPCLFRLIWCSFRFRPRYT